MPLIIVTKTHRGYYGNFYVYYYFLSFFLLSTFIDITSTMPTLNLSLTYTHTTSHHTTPHHTPTHYHFSSLTLTLTLPHTLPHNTILTVGSSAGFGNLPPAPGLSGLLGVSYIPSPQGPGSIPRRRGPSGPTDDMSLSFLGGSTPFGLPVVASSSPKVRFVSSCINVVNFYSRTNIAHIREMLTKKRWKNVDLIQDLTKTFIYVYHFSIIFQILSNDAGQYLKNDGKTISVNKRLKRSHAYKIECNLSLEYFIWA